MPMVPTVSAGVADGDSAESAAGASVAMALGGGTLTVITLHKLVMLKLLQLVQHI